MWKLLFAQLSEHAFLLKLQATRFSYSKCSYPKSQHEQWFIGAGGSFWPCSHGACDLVLERTLVV